MFKRVAKRQRKREKEEALGLDEELKQVLGLQDTDSDESVDTSSDSDSGNDSDLESDLSEENNAEDVVPTETASTSLRKRKRSARDSHSESERGSAEGRFVSTDISAPASEYAENDVDDEDGPPMGVMNAMTNPIYNIPGVPTTQDLRACIICPQKLLKNTAMVTSHTESSAHLRRLQRYTAHVSKLTANPGGLTTNDPRKILRDIDVTQNSGLTGISRDASSKRSQRREAWKTKQKERKNAIKQAQEKKKFKREAKQKDVTVDVDARAKAGRNVLKLETPGENRHGRSEATISVAVDFLVDNDERPLKGSGGSKTKDVHKHLDSESSKPERPTKRRKHDASSATSSAVEGTHVDSKKTSGNAQHGKPALNRHSTSLYFADDERRPRVPVKTRGRDRSTDKTGAQRRPKSTAKTKQRSEERKKPGYTQDLARGHNRRGKG